MASSWLCQLSLLAGFFELSFEEDDFYVLVITRNLYEQLATPSQSITDIAGIEK